MKMLNQNFTRNDLRGFLDKKENIRNMSVIAQYDTEKLNLTDSMVVAAGIPSYSLMRAVRVRTSEFSFYYKTTDAALQANKYYINLIDLPPGNVFSSEVAAALRITDGALVVVDCIKGSVSVDTETVIRQALGERIRPVLTVNKIDSCFLEPQVDGEELYATFQKVVENANVIVATFEDPLLGDFHVYPEKGTVAFSAGLHGWAFTLTNFAKMYASKFGVDESKMMERLWGENFFDPATRKWTTKNSGSPTCKRGFVQFCYEPIKQIIDVCMNDEKDKLWPMLEKLGVLLERQEKDLVGEALLKCVMQTWLPAGSALLEMMIHHLPSPATAQKYRVEKLYKGPMDDQYATAIRNCDPDGPLMLYISKMITTRHGHYFVRGRLFSGKLSNGAKVKIMGPNYVTGGEEDLYIRNFNRMAVMVGKQQATVEDVVPCGNTPFLFGLGRACKEYATLTNEEVDDTHPIRAMRGRFFCWFCGKMSNSQHVILHHASVHHSDMGYRYCGDKMCSRPLFIKGHQHFHHYPPDDDIFDDNLQVEAGYDAAYVIPSSLVEAYEDEEEKERNEDKMGGWL